VLHATNRDFRLSLGALGDLLQPLDQLILAHLQETTGPSLNYQTTESRAPEEGAHSPNSKLAKRDCSHRHSHHH
jgi:hypothetical protein